MFQLVHVILFIIVDSRLDGFRAAGGGYPEILCVGGVGVVFGDEKNIFGGHVLIIQKVQNVAMFLKKSLFCPFIASGFMGL